MHVPVPRPDPAELAAPIAADDVAALAHHLANQGGMTVVYAPSTTTITNAAPAPSPAPVEVRVPTPAGPPVESPTVRSQSRSRFTLGDVIAYSGATLMGGATISGLVSVVIGVPMLVPLLSGIIALVGLLAALGGAALDNRERLR